MDSWYVGVAGDINKVVSPEDAHSLFLRDNFKPFRFEFFFQEKKRIH